MAKLNSIIGTYFKTLFGLIFLLVLSSCGDDDGEQIPDPTPLVLQTPEHFGTNFEIPADNPMTVEGVALGRMLFYEKKLSGDNSISCGSCHQQSRAFTDEARFSKGIDGIEGTKNAMSIVNMLWTKRFFWDGRSTSLEEQAKVPIEDPVEMHESLGDAVAKLQSDADYPELFLRAFGSDTITVENMVKSIAQFERTLISSNSKFDRHLREEYEATEEELRGIQLFYTHPVAGQLRGGNCGDCHLGFLAGGSPEGFEGFHNNGLDTDENLEPGLESVTGNDFDRGKFKAPSLRNIALTAPFMHDGRFNTLEEVLDHYNEHIQGSVTLDVLIKEASNEEVIPNEPVKLHLTEQEKSDIIAFLHMLTDIDFVTNENFSDPFEND